MSQNQTVSNTEQLDRILQGEWLVDGKVQASAFALRRDETYLSVNRPSVSSFSDDVMDFIMRHPAYGSIGSVTACRVAEVNVGRVRDIRFQLGNNLAEVFVEVEPRDNNYRSHAGIFTKCDGKNVKGGQESVVISNGKHFPAKAILQKVRYALLQMAELKTLEFPLTK